MPDTSEHYVANIKVEKVVKKTGAVIDGNSTRGVTQTAQITVKAATLDRLKEKIASHVGLLDEDDL